MYYRKVFLRYCLKYKREQNPIYIIIICIIYNGAHFVLAQSRAYSIAEHLHNAYTRYNI